MALGLGVVGYLEGQGDLAGRSIMGVTGATIWLNELLCKVTYSVSLMLQVGV